MTDDRSLPDPVIPAKAGIHASVVMGPGLRRGDDEEAAQMSANPVRGEAEIVVAGERLRLRPSFAALVAAEAEIGPLFALVERAAAGQLSLAGMAALFWHCLDPRDVERDAFSEALVAGGLAAATPALKVLLTQILAGR